MSAALPSYGNMYRFVIFIFSKKLQESNHLHLSEIF